jgi:hypothetical protein
MHLIYFLIILGCSTGSCYLFKHYIWIHLEQHIIEKIIEQINITHRCWVEENICFKDPTGEIGEGLSFATNSGYVPQIIPSTSSETNPEESTLSPRWKTTKADSIMEGSTAETSTGNNSDQISGPLVQRLAILKLLLLLVSFLFVTNYILHRSFLAEILIGGSVGLLLAYLQFNETKSSSEPDCYWYGFPPHFIQQFSGLAAILPIIFAITKYNYDTYNIGLWTFNRSAFLLYVTHWLGFCLFFMMHQSFYYHPNIRNITIIWTMLLLAVFFF